MNNFFHTIGVNFDFDSGLVVGTLIITRLTMITSLIPFLVGKPVPPTIRMGFALIMTIFIYPYLAPADPTLIPKAPLYVILLYMKEMFYGIAIGMTASIVFHAFEAAGGMVDNQRGAAQARLLIPQLGEQSSIFGSFNFLLGITIFIAIGGHMLFLKSVLESYIYLPILEMPKSRPDLLLVSDDFIKMTGTVLVLSLQLTAPILISIFVSDIILGLVSKTAPSINVWELGFMIRGILGVLMYFLALELLIGQMGKISLGAMTMVDKIIRLLASGSS